LSVLDLAEWIAGAVAFHPFICDILAFDLTPCDLTFPARLRNRRTAQAIMNLHPEHAKEELDGVVTMLNLVLAEECLLYSKTRNCYWNSCGAPTPPVRELLGQQYDRLSDIIDHVTDRLRSKGAQALGTLSEFVQYARLGERPGEGPTPARMIAHLLDDQEAISRALRGDLAVCAEEFKDAGTCEFLSGLVAEHERMARTLRAQLQNS